MSETVAWLFGSSAAEEPPAATADAASATPAGGAPPPPPAVGTPAARADELWQAAEASRADADYKAVLEFLRDLPCRKIGGIGRVLEMKLADALNVCICAEIKPEFE